MKQLMLFVAFWINISSWAQGSEQSENIFIVSTDGFRWQEVFGGADSTLINDPAYVKDTSLIKQLFWSSDAGERRKRLLPFFWRVISSQGQLYGNKAYNNQVKVKNFWKISYPGYNEMLTGYADPKPLLNTPIFNPNKSVLEFFNEQQSYKGKVAAFSSWNLFTYILNAKRNVSWLNSGYTGRAKDSSETAIMINWVQDEIGGKGHTRNDLLTFLHAKEYIHLHHPKVVFLSFGETDEYAHRGQYDEYLKSANTFDKMLEELWYMIQTDPIYKGRTTLIITTDHGRGAKAEKWYTHNFLTRGSGDIWLALLGAGIEPEGEIKKSGRLYQNQIAATIATLVGLPFISNHPVGKSMVTFTY